jgi:hypothetical protein
MKIYGGVEAKFHKFLTSELNGEKWSALRRETEPTVPIMQEAE